MSGLASAGATVVLTLLALVTGAGLGHWWGARHLVRRSPPLAGWSLIAGGAGLRLAVELVPLPGAAALVVTSHALLLAACLLNLGRTGVPIVALGLLVMLAPTVVDGGMPVGREALATMGWPSPAPELPGGRHVEVERDRILVLGDVLPLPLGGRPVSFGELIVLAGLADLAFHAAGRLAGQRLRRLGVLRSVPGDPAASGALTWSDLVLADLEDEAPTVVVLGPAPAPAPAPGAAVRPLVSTHRGSTPVRRPRPADRADRDDRVEWDEPA